jgi:membrane protein DedA with SNARE-associated domain
MEQNLMLYLQNLIEEAHILVLFFTLTFTLAAAPINKETVVITMAIMSGNGVINPILAFLVLVFANYISYFVFFFIGRFSEMLKKIVLNEKSVRIGKQIDKSNHFIEKYGPISIIISYFIPGVRQVLPVIMGMTPFKLSRFMWISFWGSLIWMGFIYTIAFSLTELWIQ